MESSASAIKAAAAVVVVVVVVVIAVVVIAVVVIAVALIALFASASNYLILPRYRSTAEKATQLTLSLPSTMDPSGDSDKL